MAFFLKKELILKVNLPKRSLIKRSLKIIFRDQSYIK